MRKKSSLTSLSTLAITVSFLTPYAKANQIRSSCWNMHTDVASAAGHGAGWKFLGACSVTLAGDGSVKTITLQRGETYKIKPFPNYNGFVLKPGQSPVGLWTYGIWKDDSQKSAVVATETWKPSWRY